MINSKLKLLLKQKYIYTVGKPEVLDEIEKIVELVKKYIRGDNINIKNYRDKLSEYTLDKSFLYDKTIQEKIKLLEIICNKLTMFINNMIDQQSLIEEINLIC